ncbi:hypothetical protein SH528x_001143 [Novipirellula sp. SH528]|uniref:hypothetical protein n=1 Tax=Novipirellula sp. SH528 TaxID=3454466 RepID=UPI003FA0D15C
MLSLQNDNAEQPHELIQGTVKRASGIHSVRFDESHDNELFSQFLKRSVKWFVIASVLGAAVAWWAGDRFAKDTYTYTGRLTLEQSTVGYPFFAVPLATDMVVLIDAPDTIRELYETLPLQDPESATAKAIEVQATKGAFDIVLEYGAADAETAEQVVNTLMQIVGDKSREIRNGTITKHLATLDNRTAQLAAERSESQAAYDQLCLEHNSHDLHSEIDANLVARREAKAILARQRILIELRQQSVSQLEQHVADARVGKFDEDKRTIMQNDVVRLAEQERRVMLTDQLHEHRRRETAKIQLDSKLKELANLKSLYDRSLVTQSEFQALQSEVDVLRLESGGDKRTAEINGSITKIFDDIDSGGYVDDAVRSKILVQLDEKLRDEQEKLQLLEAELNSYEELIAKLNDEYKSLVALSPKLRDFKVALESITHQQDRVKEERQAMERLLQTDGYVLKTTSPAAPALNPVSSNKAKVMVAGFGAGSMLLLLPALLIEFFRASPNQHERLASKHGLPILSRHTRDSAKRPAGGTTSRILASRIQRLNLAVGSSVALVATGRKACPTGILFGAASHLSREGGRVLIVEVITSGKITPFPSEHAVESIQDQEMQIGKTEKVDRLLIKDPALLCDAMSHNTWDELAASIRAYQYIMIGGLSASDSTTATLVASGADAVIVCSLERDGASPAATNLINDLIDFDARLLGAVIAS